MRLMQIRIVRGKDTAPIHHDQMPHAHMQQVQSDCATGGTGTVDDNPHLSDVLFRHAQCVQ